MYLFYLTLKTPNGLFAAGILVYTILLAILCPFLRKREKKALPVVLCILHVLAALIHFGVYGTITLDKFTFLYIEALMPLLLLLPGKSGVLTAAKSVTASAATLALCFVFLIHALSWPMVHHFTRCSYTESFTRIC